MPLFMDNYMIYCDKKFPRRLCEDIEPHIMIPGGKVVRRPFNRFQPDVTGWWLVPSLELPFYRCGKIYCDWGDSERQTITCGFYLEKGLAAEVAVVYSSKKGRALIMNDSWQWCNFVADCTNGTFLHALKCAAANSGLPVEVHISGGYVDDPALFDPYSEIQKKDHFIFDLQNDYETLKYRCAKRDAMVLKPLNKVKTLTDFSLAVKEFSADHFLWLNVFISARFNILSEGPSDSTDVWSSEKIWKHFLINFTPWLK